jgi:histone arginine demethylase JMJD6
MTISRDTANGPFLADRIDRHAWSTIGRARYLREYIQQLNPVIITGGFDDWQARKKWTLDFFKEQYGDLPLDVDGRRLSMSTLIDEVKSSTAERPAPYLRNHLVKNLPEELQRDIYPMPECTGPNWLDKRFLKVWKDWTYVELYIGGTGAKFPMLHYDGKHTHAFLMQLQGVKEYVAFPPSQKPHMYAGDGPHNENRSVIDNVESPDLKRFPRFAGASGMRFTLHAGETLYVPAGWWHTARILSPSITVSVNGVNAANWRDFSHDVRRIYWAEPKAKRAIGSVYLFLAGILLRLTDEPYSHNLNSWTRQTRHRDSRSPTGG